MNKKVLVIEDDPELLYEIKEALILSGYEAEGLSSGVHAAEKACAMKPDIILLDLKLGVKSGFQVADDLKNLPETKNIPIIVMTGSFTEKQHAAFVHRLGVEQFILKPVKLEDVLSRIELLTSEVSVLH